MSLAKPQVVPRFGRWGKSGWEVLTNHLGSINHSVFSLPVFDHSLSTYCRRSMVICVCLHQQAQG